MSKRLATFLSLSIGCSVGGIAKTDDTSGAIDDTSVTTVDSSTDTNTDTGTAPSTAASPAEVSWRLSDEIYTVAFVSWTTEAETTGYVEYGETSDYGFTTPLTSSAVSHEQVLLGLAADTDWHFRVVSVDGDIETASADTVLTTGTVPAALPTLTATGTASSWDGFQVLPIQGTTNSVVIIDNQGRYVWYHVIEDDGNLMQAFVSVDGKSVVLCLAGDQQSLEEGVIYRIALDGTESTKTELPYLDHDLTELPDGTLAAIVVDERDDTAADAIVEIATDGTTTEVFNAWDVWEAEELGVEMPTHNWTHANALNYDAADDAYYMSMKDLNSLVKIDRATGSVEWGMNGPLNDFTFTDGTVLEMFHQFEVLEDSIVFFENGAQSRGYSRAVEIAVDLDAMTAYERWSYVRDPSVYVYAKGDVARFEDGSTQVVWSTSGEIQLVDSSDTVTWQLNGDLGYVITFVSAVDSLYGTP